MLDLMLYVFILIVTLAAVALNLVSLPGNWLVLVGAIGLSVMHSGARPHWFFLIVILLILSAAELVEFFSGMVGARKFGASKTASWAALGGAIIGGLIGIPPLTVPMLFTDHFVAAIFGAFLAAWIVELIKRRPMGHASKAAFGAALGRGVGLAGKIGAGMLAWVVLAVTYWWPK
jgi:uncharacterized protein YqgC (DUF456 family)